MEGLLQSRQIRLSVLLPYSQKEMRPIWLSFQHQSLWLGCWTPTWRTDSEAQLLLLRSWVQLMNSQTTRYPAGHSKQPAKCLVLLTLMAWWLVVAVTV